MATDRGQHVGVDLARVAAVLRRIAYDIDELAVPAPWPTWTRPPIIGD
ncbi:hypothetical protein [Sphaerisporangium krabiense]|uniref:Uncharacterized protein n=1 Tax=Sphaerisporangium krabiense TaxID=763782 RepID=A0A7W9DVS1_9ACTN|nr:hypothetical protein [Sphaerisporangium krabiense]MBB5631750.1 hypothetical protein [Sphaerisporangium krabiense]